MSSRDVCLFGEMEEQSKSLHRLTAKLVMKQTLFLQRFLLIATTSTCTIIPFPPHSYSKSPTQHLQTLGLVSPNPRASFSPSMTRCQHDKLLCNQIQLLPPTTIFQAQAAIFRHFRLDRTVTRHSFYQPLKQERLDVPCRLPGTLE